MENLRKKLIKKGLYFPLTEKEKAKGVSYSYLREDLPEWMTEFSSLVELHLGMNNHIHDGEKIPENHKPSMFHGYNLTHEIFESVTFILHVHVLLPYWQRELECKINDIECEVFDVFMPKY